MRDAQFGVRRYEGAVLQLFDGDDSRAAWEAVGARIEARFSRGKFGGAILKRQVAKRLVVTGGQVTAVELADTPAGPPAEVPTVAPRTPGAVTTTLPADAVVSTLLPQCLAPLLRDEPSAEPLVRTMTKLSSFMNETINLAYGKGNTLVRMAELVGEALGKTPDITLAPPLVGEVTHYIANISKATSLLGYVPRVSLEEGIPRAVKWQMDWMSSPRSADLPEMPDENLSAIDQGAGSGIAFKEVYAKT
jgi:hypothetical protein